ncbi:MAG: Tic20 family protein [Microcoleaceae cyanobacterium]
MSLRGSTTVPDRIFACLPYLLPLMDGISYGQFLFQQFPPLQLILLPLGPLLQIYTLPLAGFVIFLALYFAVVRNENISHFIRFNAMQAILIDIVLILCNIILSLFTRALSGGFIMETIYNMIFLGMIISIGYSVIQSALGRYAEIPTISDAVYMQVR